MDWKLTAVGFFAAGLRAFATLAFVLGAAAAAVFLVDVAAAVFLGAAGF